MKAILEITDGTLEGTVDLLDFKGWLLKEWNPAVAEPKGGGIFRSSPLTDGRKLAYRRMDNITDTFNLVGSKGSQDELISSIKKLYRVLEKATEYWTSGWQTTPVYMRARGSMETEIRYSTIVDYRLSGFGSPYQQPFFGGCNAATEAIMVIEHMFWQDTVPGDRGKCVELKSRTDYPGIATYDSDAFVPAHSLADVTYSPSYLTCNSTAHTLGIGYVTPFKGKCEAGIIFENVDIPAGSIVKSATLRVKVAAVSLNTDIVVSGQSQEGGGIDSVTLVDGGHNYHSPKVTIMSSVSGTGWGAVVVASVCDPSSSEECHQTGEIFELTIVEPGYGYINPTVIISDEGCDMLPCGSGASATCTARTVGTDAALFDGTNADFLTRPRTRNVARKNFATTTLAATVDIPITYVVREIISNDYWDSGDNIGIFIALKESSASGGVGLEIYSYDEGADYPQLIIEWSSLIAPIGRDTTCAQEVFVSNKHNSAPVKYMFAYNDNGGVKWSLNMFEWDFTTQMPMFQDNTKAAFAPESNDAIYFGSCPSSAYDNDYGPFCSLVFDIYQGQTGISDARWEYWNGATWHEFDTTDSATRELCSDNILLDKTGVTSVVWKLPTDWAKNDPGAGLTGYWVRYRVQTVSGGTTPYQWHRDIYTVNNPYIDIAASRVPGDIPALAKINFDSAACWQRSMNTLVLGLRSLSRGEEFDAYLNVSDIQNAEGITFKTEGITEDSPYIPMTDMVDSPETPTGRLLPLNNFDPNVHGVSDMTPICSWELNQDIAKQYIGIYHAYLRCKFGSLSSPGNVRLRLKAVFGDEYNVSYSEITTVSLAGFVCSIDMGQLIIMPPYSIHANDDIGRVKLYVESYCDTDSYYDNAYLYDVILMPADEWSGNFGMPKITGTSVLTYDYGVEVDGITVPRQYRAMEVHKVGDTKQVVAEWSRIASSEPIFQANSDQRLWFMQYKHQDGLVSYFENCGAICAERSSRYLLMRGSE